jgi:NAD+ synthase (glutamine-hydrolysing)
MLVSLCQINTTPNDFAGNFSKITSGIALAHEGQKPNLIIFPELTIPGYSVKDLVYTNDFVETNLNYLHKLCDVTKDLTSTIVVGYIGKNTKGSGKPFTNMAAVIHNGHVVATYQKHLLPFYDVFDEGRYFEPGNDLTVFEVEGVKFGITICEDCWNDKDQDNYSYKDNPIQGYRNLGITDIINLSSSPYALDKPIARNIMLEKISGDGNLNIYYCNQYGGQDELVFDGKSSVYKKGRLVEIARTDLNPRVGSSKIVVVNHNTQIGGGWFDFYNEVKNDHYKMTLLGLHDYIVKSGFKEVVLGSSGGIDSAVVAALAAEAIGPQNVNCIMMPSIYSSGGSVDDAKKLHANLGCKEHLVPIRHEDLMHHINTCLGFEEAHVGFNTEKDEVETTYTPKISYNTVADENLQARMRGQIVMHFSNATGALPLTTGNKTEMAVGYCTLYGDMNGGFNPIGDMYKMQVYDIARKINAIAGKEVIPQAIIDKAPSAELRPGQTDEASLLPYPILDRIVQVYIEHKVTDFDKFVHLIATKSLFDNVHILRWAENREEALAGYTKIKRLIYNAEFKRRQAAPTIKLSRVAFGTGRRIPIVKGTGK